MKNNRFMLVKLMTITLFSLFALISRAQSTKIGVQGLLRKGDGKSVEDGSYAITFRLYDAVTGGTVVWSEVQPQVEVVGDIYSTQLGSVNSLSLPFDSDYYLSVQVEDSPEITPRQQLTVAPYALSFKGSGNVFPSSGAIGIGTISPTSGHNLHIKNNSGQASQFIEGWDGSKVDIKKGATVASIGHHSTISLLEINAGSNNTAIQYNGSDKLVVNGSGITVTGTGTFSDKITANTGTVALGSFSVSQSDVNCNNDSNIKYNGTAKLGVRGNGAEIFGHLKVMGTKNYTGAFAYYNSSGNPGCESNNGSTNGYSISCTQRVRAPEFNAFSDKRIKKEITTSNSVDDLDILRKLNVRNYRYTDLLMNGNGFKKGFIAQEVREVFPESVTSTTGVVPDIFQMATLIQYTGNQLTVTTPAAHGLVSGETVRLIFDGKKGECEIESVPDAQTFTVANWQEPAPEQVFVYGRQVDDFLQVDYDRIHTLNVSVTQELLRRKDAIEREKAALKRENENLRVSLEEIDIRMRKIESTLSH